MPQVGWQTVCSRLLLLAAISFSDMGSPTQGHLRNRRSKPTYTIGLLIIVDYGLWKRWRADANSESDAVKNIEYYFTHVIDRVNARYMTLKDDQYELRVVLQDLQITKMPSNSPWTETIKLMSSEGRDVVNATLAVDKLGDLVEKDMDAYQQYDHIVGITGYDLFAVQNGVRNYGKIGSAILGGICDQWKKVSVVEDRRDYNSIIGLAHEMAHSFNAKHDGDNNCDPADQHIMAPIIETQGNGETGAITSFTSFSSCSSQEIANHITKLNSASMNCLVDSPQPYGGQNQWLENLKVLPGQKLDHDAQCTVVLGEPSFYCGLPEKAKEACQALLCHRGNGCYRLQGNRAFDGTSCGYKKWCLGGACVYDDTAPAVDEACPFGDYVPAQCNMKNISYYCNADQTRKLCCKTCPSIRDDTKPGCEYGDKSPDCTTLTKDHCRTASNTEVCCKTCHSEACLTGDTKPDCDVRKDCDDGERRRQCCQTCSQLSNSAPGASVLKNVPLFILAMATTYIHRSLIDRG